MIFDRTFHPDEANQAIITGTLLETGRYTYQPDDHHGPTLYYAAAAIQKFAGRSSCAELDGTLLRSTSLISAIGAILLIFFGIRRFTKSFLAAFLGIFFLALSPIFIFFATDFIQEMIFAATLAFMFFSASRYISWRDGERLKRGSWAIFFGIGTGLAFATKETCILSFASAALSLTAIILIYKQKLDLTLKEKINSSIFAIFSFFLTAILLYSSFGADMTGVYNAFIKAPSMYFQRAQGSALSEGANYHVHEWWWYLKLLFFPDMGNFKIFESLPPAKAFSRIFTFGWRFSLLPLIFAISLGFSNGKSRISKIFLFTTLYSFILLLIYSLIPYKTPWCMLTVVEGMAISAALGTWIFLSSNKNKWVKVAAFSIIFALSLFINIRGIIFINKYPDVKTIPYNYAHASYDVQDLAEKTISSLKASNNDFEYAAIILPREDTWPLPWYLRKYSKRIGYWQDAKSFINFAKRNPPVCIITTPSEEESLGEFTKTLPNKSTHSIRPGKIVNIFTK